jgi:hypothetical protein
LATHWNPQEVSEWSLSSFIPDIDFVGALAINGRIERFDFWQWGEVQN